MLAPATQFALPKLTADCNTQRLAVRGDLDRAYLALGVLSQERGLRARKTRPSRLRRRERFA